MALADSWCPPSREHYDLILSIWNLFPLAASLQWAISWYGMGKTSTDSRLNLPGRIAWITMESPGFLTLLYIVKTLPAQHGITDLPWQNRVLAGLYVIHYLYRALIFPCIQPSMSPIHPLIWVSALAFQLVNATCLGAWLAAYGPVTRDQWAAQLHPYPTLQFSTGVLLFYAGLAANFLHDDELRDIRRRRRRRRRSSSNNNGNGVDKHYAVPQAGLFRYVLYPHYLVEWVEWTGFYVACGLRCAPARIFVINEISAMLPRAVRGRRWYVQRFGEEKIRGRWAVIPGIC